MSSDIKYYILNIFISYQTNKSFVLLKKYITLSIYNKHKKVTGPYLYTIKIIVILTQQIKYN